MTPARPRRFWVITAAALLGFAAALWLGAWQLSRAAHKEALQNAISERKGLVARTSRSLLATKNVADVVHMPVLLRGRWLPEHTVYLDNRQMQGKPGFYVVTPLALEEGGVVAVQRGWVQRDFLQRDRLPTVQTPSGAVEVPGRIAPPPAKLYELGSPGTGAIRQNLDLGEFSARTGLALRQDLSVQQLGPASEGLLRDWPPAASGVEKNYGYAFQWFALAALIATLYVWFQFVAPRRKSRRA